MATHFYFNKMSFGIFKKLKEGFKKLGRGAKFIGGKLVNIGRKFVGPVVDKFLPGVGEIASDVVNTVYDEYKKDKEKKIKKRKIYAEDDDDEYEYDKPKESRRKQLMRRPRFEEENDDEPAIRFAESRRRKQFSTRTPSSFVEEEENDEPKFKPTKPRFNKSYPSRFADEEPDDASYKDSTSYLSDEEPNKDSTDPIRIYNSQAYTRPKKTINEFVNDGAKHSLMSSRIPQEFNKSTKIMRWSNNY